MTNLSISRSEGSALRRLCTSSFEPSLVDHRFKNGYVTLEFSNPNTAVTFSLANACTKFRVLEVRDVVRWRYLKKTAGAELTPRKMVSPVSGSETCKGSGSTLLHTLKLSLASYRPDVELDRAVVTADNLVVFKQLDQ